jgi:ribosomal protein S21
MNDRIRSKDYQLYKKPIQRERFVSQMREVTQFEQALVSARSEIEQALRRFAKRIQNDQEAA